jgi:hypothetical protein
MEDRQSNMEGLIMDVWDIHKGYFGMLEFLLYRTSIQQCL